MQREMREVCTKLASDQGALRALLADPTAWIEREYPNLSTAGKREVLAIAGDYQNFVEKRCREGLSSSPEARFMKGEPIERRRFLLTASSALLASGFVLLSAGGVAKGATGGAQSESLAGAGDDTGCAIDSTCNNSSGTCQDDSCENTVQCNDSSGTCKDDNCTNRTECNDSANCQDTHNCSNGTECNDEAGSWCLDGGPEGACSNTQDCVNNDCTDNPCTNNSNCRDNNCIDGECTNNSDCTNEAQCR